MRFETLMERYHDEIFAYLWRLVENASWTNGAADPSADAQDLVQEVFLRAYGGFERLRPDSNYRAWLYRIATNCVYTALKRSRRGAGRALPLPEEDEGQAFPVETGPGPMGLVVRREMRSTLEAAIAGLPAKQQAAVVLRHVQGLEYAEIAQALGCSEDSARANVYQALKRLRVTLSEDEDFYPETGETGI